MDGENIKLPTSRQLNLHFVKGMEVLTGRWGGGGRECQHWLMSVHRWSEGSWKLEIELGRVGYRVFGPWVCLGFLAMGWVLCPWTLECVVLRGGYA